MKAGDGKGASGRVRGAREKPGALEPEKGRVEGATPAEARGGEESRGRRMKGGARKA